MSNDDANEAYGAYGTWNSNEDSLAMEQLQNDNMSLRKDNLSMREEMQRMMVHTKTRMSQLTDKLQEYEVEQSIRDAEIATLKAQQRTVLTDEVSKSNELVTQIESQWKSRLQDKEQELALVHQLLGKKQEDFLFGIEQLKDIKTWAKKTIREIAERAKGEIAKRDRKIHECETEIQTKQETIDQVWTDLFTY